MSDWIHVSYLGRKARRMRREYEEELKAWIHERESRGEKYHVFDEHPDYLKEIEFKQKEAYWHYASEKAKLEGNYDDEFKALRNWFLFTDSDRERHETLSKHGLTSPEYREKFQKELIDGVIV